MPANPLFYKKAVKIAAALDLCPKPVGLWQVGGYALVWPDL